MTIYDYRMEGMIKITGLELIENPTYLSKDIVRWTDQNKYTVKQFLKLMYMVAPPLVKQFKQQFTTLTPTPFDEDISRPVKLETYES